MKTLKIGKKEYTVLTGNEMFVIRMTLNGVLADLDFVEEHLLRMANTSDDMLRLRVSQDIRSSHGITIHAKERCELTLKYLEES